MRLRSEVEEQILPLTCVYTKINDSYCISFRAAVRKKAPYRNLFRKYEEYLLSSILGVSPLREARSLFFIVRTDIETHA